MTLDEYLWRHKITCRDFSALVGASDSMVSAVKNKLRRPSIELAQRIEKATKGVVLTTELLGLDTKKTPKKVRR